MPLRVIIVAILCVLFVTPSEASLAKMRAVTSASTPILFDSEAAAHTHCPRDVVVWLNTKTGIYHEKGMRWYGRTKHGAFVCKSEADSAGDRDTRNGQ